MANYLLRNLLLFNFCYITNSLLFCQTDTLNKFNANEKKHGYWKEFFDQNILPIDSARAYFFGYQLYDNGYKLWTFQPTKRKKKLKLKYNKSIPKEGNPRILEGDFSWYTPDSVVKFEESYRNGTPLIFKHYTQRSTDKVNRLFEVTDFSKTYNGVLGTFLVTIYHLYSDTDFESYYYIKTNRKWKFEKVQKKQD